MSELRLIESSEEYKRLSNDPKERQKIAVICTGGEHKIFTVHGLSYDSQPVYEGGQWVRTVKIKSSWYVQNLTISKDKIDEKIKAVAKKHRFEYYHVGDDMLSLELNQYNDPVYWSRYYATEEETFINFGKYEHYPLNEETIKDDLDYFVFMVDGSDWKPKTEKTVACLNYIREMPIVQNAIQRAKSLEAKKEAEKKKKARKLAKKRAKSDFVGEEGSRMELNLTIDKVFTYYSHYTQDDQMGIRLLDSNDNQFIYWNTFNMPRGENEDGYFNTVYIEDGDKVNIKATIKNHDENEEYGKTTTLSRIYAYGIKKVNGDRMLKRNELNKLKNRTYRKGNEPKGAV